MNWYERLAKYFPANEMKDPDHIQDLLSHHEAYHKLETDDYVVTYAEFPTFIFIDYLLVQSRTRGKGVGSKILDAFKKRHKPLIVEVEPSDVEEPDTQRRITFYEKNGFNKAENIVYTRSDEDGTPFTLDIYYWSPEDIAETEILHNMQHICREIHNFMAVKHYGRLLADPEEVLTWDGDQP